MLTNFFRSIPHELLESAITDGARNFAVLWRIVLPLSTPALVVVCLFSFTQAWNEFLYAYMFLRSNEVFTLPVGLNQLIVGDVQPWGQLMAASLLTALPVVIIYMLGQRFMVAGLTAGSVKG
jgi:multiple sugar transport system permease protein